jgi:hypothetical protein
MGNGPINEMFVVTLRSRTACCDENRPAVRSVVAYWICTHGGGGIELLFLSFHAVTIVIFHIAQRIN